MSFKFWLDPTRSAHFMSSISSTCHCTAHLFSSGAVIIGKLETQWYPSCPVWRPFSCARSVLDKSCCFEGIGEEHCIIIEKAISISSLQVDLKSVIQEKTQLDAQLTLCLHPHNVFISRFHEFRIVQDRWGGSFLKFCLAGMILTPSLAIPCLQGVPAHSSNKWPGT